MMGWAHNVRGVGSGLSDPRSACLLRPDFSQLLKRPSWPPWRGEMGCVRWRFDVEEGLIGEIFLCGK